MGGTTSKANKITPLNVENGQPSAAQFARAISDSARCEDEKFMRQVFNRHAIDEKLSVSALIAALKDVAAPVLHAASSEDSSDVAEYVFRHADANLRGDLNFVE